MTDPNSSARTHSALTGATIIVTRPSVASAPLKRRITALGGTALGLPGVGLYPAQDQATVRAALRAARNADIVVFISPSAVRYAFATLPALRFSRATRICAIGAGGAAALHRRHLREVAWPRQRQDSEGLLALEEFAHVRRRRVALIGAPGGRDLLSVALGERGAIAQNIHVYRRGKPRLDRRHFVALERAASPLLTLLSSAEALTNLRSLLPQPLFARLATGEGIVSSLRLAQAAHSAGFLRTHVAASAAAADMLAAATTALAQHRL